MGFYMIGNLTRVCSARVCSGGVRSFSSNGSKPSGVGLALVLGVFGAGGTLYSAKVGGTLAYRETANSLKDKNLSPITKSAIAAAAAAGGGAGGFVAGGLIMGSAVFGVLIGEPLLGAMAGSLAAQHMSLCFDIDQSLKSEQEKKVNKKE